MVGVIIGSMAFKNCDSVKQIAIYDVESINNYAFDGCTALTELFISNIEPP